MAKEEKPLEYQGRIRDTKGVAQRLDLGYLNRPRVLAVLRSRLTWILLALSLIAGAALVAGAGGSRTAVANGPVTEAHALYAQRCEVCHDRLFKGTPDAACQACHDGAPHPAVQADTARPDAAPPCARCHVEHRGRAALSEVADAACTSCHGDLKAHASSVTLRSSRITGFKEGQHPEFSAAGSLDERPIRLNHAIHMPAQGKTIRNIKLPMSCGDCHITDPNSAEGAFQPVTFAQCAPCHARELEYDVYHLLGAAAPPAPHTKNPQAIHQIITAAYRDALARNPALARRPLGNDLTPPANWLERAVKDSEEYLFNRKCGYCHTMIGYAVVKPVNSIAGRYDPSKPNGQPWLPRSEFAHRRHRAEDCASCHTTARTSTKTSDVLIPTMKSCLPCHSQSEARLSRCSECHLYHNRSLQKERDGAAAAMALRSQQ